MKRTRRYRGFLIGDRVRVKDTAKTSCKGSGRVMGYNGAKIVVESYPMKGMVHEFMPNQLINLTRIEEEKRRITDPLPLMREETADELIERIQRMQIENWKLEDIGNNLSSLFTGNSPLPQMDVEDGIINPLWDLSQMGIDAYNPDPLPSPYSRDVYSSTRDFMLYNISKNFPT